MDDIELLVEETLRHFNEHYASSEEMKHELFIESFDRVVSFPVTAGVIYHVQKSASIFVIRTVVSENIRDDYFKIIEAPENYPSLRLLEGGEGDLASKLRFFPLESSTQAEAIHRELHNRRFPINEEIVCNISDPGFSWWLTNRPEGFQLSFTLLVAPDEKTIKLGPLGDRELAIKRFQVLQDLVSSAGIEMNIQNETNRVQFSDSDEFILTELKKLFEYGVVSNTLMDIFMVLAKKAPDSSLLQATWFYLQEIAAVRRFWIQIQLDLKN